MYAIDGRLTQLVTLKEDLLAVGRKDRRDRGRIARAVLAQRQLALRRAQQQQNVRRGLVAARAHKDRRIAVGVEMHELAGLAHERVLMQIGGMLADGVELVLLGGKAEIEKGSPVGSPARGSDGAGR